MYPQNITIFFQTKNSISSILTLKLTHQVFMAAIISTLYGMVMIAVIVGTAINIVQDGILSPTAMFLMLLISQIVITAILHTEEMFCILYSVIYFITVPSMYVLLIIYSVCNLNDITWGTREIKTKKTAAVIIYILNQLIFLILYPLLLLKVKGKKKELYNYFITIL